MPDELSEAELKAMYSTVAPSEFLSEIEKVRMRKSWLAARDYEQQLAGIMAAAGREANAVARAEQAEARERVLRDALDGLVEWCAGPLALEGRGAAESDRTEEPINCLLTPGTLRAGRVALGKARAALAASPQADRERPVERSS